MPLSRTSYTCIALFLCVHSVGAHYTYSEAPYDKQLCDVGSWGGPCLSTVTGAHAGDRRRRVLVLATLNVERRRRQAKLPVERRRTERRSGEGDAVALVVSVCLDRGR